MALTTTSLARQFFDKAARLRRTNWENPQLLADELFSIFRSVLEIAEQADENDDDGEGDDDGGTTRPSDNIGGVTIVKGNETFPSGTGPNYDAIDWPGAGSGNGTGSPQSIPDPTTNPIIMYGEVQAKVDGFNYLVTCWAKDPASNPPIGVLAVRQGLIDPDDTIPSGTPTLVIAFPVQTSVANAPFQISGARMQIPIWLRPQT